MNLLDLAIKIIADDQASEKIGGIASGIKDKLGSAASAVGKSLAVATGAAVAGAGAIGKASVDGYASYEQLWGGVQKLYGNAGQTLEEYADSVGKTVDEVSGDYQRNSEAEELMAKNAQNSWRTAGMSANDYMENATQFSAALINSLGGDTVKAANLTDKAMGAISDNVNTFGSDAESVTNAVIGLSRQNYTMLDNLKLGYAGTAEGMVNLINDSGVLGETLTSTADLASVGFDQMIEAIVAVQEQQGIAGTTSREAMGTIEGSVNAAKAAWANLVAELSKPDADIGARIGDMITAVFGEEGEDGREGGVIQNVMNTVRRLGQNVAAALPEQVPVIISAIQAILPQFTATVMEVLPPLLEALVQIFAAIAQQLPTFIAALVPVIVSLFPTMVEAGFQLFLGLVQALAQSGPEIINALVNCLMEVIDLVIEYAPQLLEAAGTLFMAIATALLERAPEILGKLTEMLVSLVETVIGHAPEMLAGGLELIGAILEAIAKAVPDILGELGKLLDDMVKAIGDGVKDMLKAGGDLLKGLLDGVVDGGKAVFDWFAHIPEDIGNFFSNAGNWLITAGWNILVGFYNGLVDAWNQYVVGFISDIGRWIAEHKGPESYDKRLLVKNGQWVMRGLYDGLRSGFEADVIPYVKDMAGRMEGAFGDASLSMGTSAQMLEPSWSMRSRNAQRQVGDLPPQLTVIMEVDRTQFGKAVYQLNNEETQRVGTRLALEPTLKAVTV